MNVLALDTTSRCASLAVLRDDAIQLEYNFSSAGDISSLLVPSLEFLLKSLKLTIADIDVFGVGIGPGLFTGIRVGLAALKGLLFGHEKPVVPVVTLRALACKLSESKSAVSPLIDARRGEVYAACYRFAAGAMIEEIPPLLAKTDELPRRLGACESPNFVGSGAENHRQSLKKLFPQCQIFYRSHFLASEIGRLAFSEYGQNRYLTDLQGLLPLYIRRPDAEKNQGAGGGGGDGENPDSPG